MPSKQVPQKRLLSYCSECRRAITVDTPAAWQRSGATGLVHTACATDPDAQPVNAAAVRYLPRLSDLP